MALIPCIYCGQMISEHASTCPKCNKFNPFDYKEKRETEILEGLKKENQKIMEELEKQKEKVLDKMINCEECGLGVTRLREVVKQSGFPLNVNVGGFNYTCKNCGFSYTFRCRCGKPARVYDLETQSLSCYMHEAEVCTRCGKLVSGKDKFTREKYLHCKSCRENLSDVKPKKNWLSRVFGT